MEPSSGSGIIGATGHPPSPPKPLGPSYFQADRKVGFFFANRPDRKVGFFFALNWAETEAHDGFNRNTQPKPDCR